VRGHCLMPVEIGMHLIMGTCNPGHICWRQNRNFLGLRLAFTSVWDTFCVSKIMTSDL